MKSMPISPNERADWNRRRFASCFSALATDPAKGSDLLGALVREMEGRVPPKKASAGHPAARMPHPGRP